MRYESLWRPRTIPLLALLLAGYLHSPAQFPAPAVSPESAYSIPQAQLIQAGELNRLLANRVAVKPLILQVGSHVLFAQSHIPGSEYVGSGSQATGLQQLQNRVAPLSRKTFIVLYCGCCPWNRCPNVGPAFKQLHDLGFTNVKVLYLADNFGTDWVDKRYQVERGR